MKKSSAKEFIIKAKEIHGDKYDYSKVEYINSLTKVCIICSIHGEFWQRPDMHINKSYGCYACGKKRAGIAQSFTAEQFIKKAKEIHGDKYNYSKVEYKTTSNFVEIICKEHGSFFQTPHKHFIGQGCPLCFSSKGESNIRKFLMKKNIKFEEQKRFKNCRDKLPLPFDFYLPEYTLLIEYDGELHFKKSRRKNANYKFEKTLFHDKIKNEFCVENGIQLLRIPYFLNNIEEEIDKSIKRSM